MKITTFSIMTLALLAIIGLLSVLGGVKANDACCLVPCDNISNPDCHSTCQKVSGVSDCGDVTPIPYPNCSPRKCGLEVTENTLGVDNKVTTSKASEVVVKKDDNHV